MQAIISSMDEKVTIEVCASANSAVLNSMKGLDGTAAPTAKERDSATGAQAATLLDMAKNRAAVSLGKRRAATAAPGELSAIGSIGGKKGGKARAKALTPARRAEIARKAATKRWAEAKKAR